MAELLVGGAFLSAFLQVLFDRMASPEFIGFFKNRKLNDELIDRLNLRAVFVKGVLEHAEMQQIISSNSSSAINRCLNELKDAVYDAEDLMDEIMTEASQYRLRAAEHDISICKQVLCLCNSPVSSSSILEFESQLKKILEKLDFIVNRREVLALGNESARVIVTPKLLNYQTTSLLEDPDHFYLRKSEKDDMIEMLLSDQPVIEHTPSVVAVVGMGGVGKTILTKLIYNDVKVDDVFKKNKAWVCVSQYFDTYRLTKATLEEFSCLGPEKESLNQLQLKLKTHLSGKKFLVILDDAWNEDVPEWSTFLAPFRSGAEGSKIVVTTRHLEVAKSMRFTSLYHLKTLQEEESWSLFVNHAFDGGDAPESSLEGIGREIVKKCDGLPLALKAIGCLLHSERDPKKWEAISKSSIWKPSGSGGTKNINILPALLLSYHHLPLHLKRCFAYCSIFPKNIEYEKQQLVLLWMAEGLIEEELENGLTLEEVGDDYFSVLISRSLLQYSDNDKSRFKMHELVNDLAKFVAGECFFSLDGKNLHGFSPTTRHISYVKTDFDVYSKFEVLSNASHLRTFLSLDSKKSPDSFHFINVEVITHLVPSLKRLRVLSLLRYELTSKLPDSIGRLKHLRYINLSYTGITALPDSVTNLINLQTLLLAYCKSLKELPKNMTRLRNLRHLDTRGAPLTRTPSGMNQLKNLQTLTDFFLAEDKGNQVKELGELHNLKGFLSVHGLQNVEDSGDAAAANLQGKMYLNWIEFEWSATDASRSMQQQQQEDDLNVLEKLRPSTNLKELTIRFYRGLTFPGWVTDGSSFSNISALRIEDCKQCSLLPPLRQLVSLQRLLIKGLDGVVTIGTELNGARLKRLDIVDMKNLQEWATQQQGEPQEAFPLLERLKICGCPSLRGALPTHLSSLTKLTVRHCPQLEAEEQLPRASSQLWKLHLEDCNKLGQEGFKIASSSVTKFKAASLGQFEFSTTTHEHLRAISVHNCDSLRSFPLDLFPKLEVVVCSGNRYLESFSVAGGDSARGRQPLQLAELSIYNCTKLSSLFPRGGLPAPLLTRMILSRCHTLNSLPENMSTLLPSLQSLELQDCPQLVCFPQGGLPLSLVELTICHCKNLTKSRNRWALQSLHSLKSFSIREESEEDLTSFPDVGLLPTSLTSLVMWDLSALTSLNMEGLKELTSLTSLLIGQLEKLTSLMGIHGLNCLQFVTICGCPTLTSIPSCPLSLSRLMVWDCINLTKRCQKKKGRDWSKISRIPCIVVERDLIT